MTVFQVILVLLPVSFKSLRGVHIYIYMYVCNFLLRNIICALYFLEGRRVWYLSVYEIC